MKPVLKFKEFDRNNIDNYDILQILGSFKPQTCELTIYKYPLFFKYKETKSKNVESVLIHELEHFRQYSLIARSKNGINFLDSNFNKIYNKKFYKKIIDKMPRLTQEEEKKAIELKRAINYDNEVSSFIKDLENKFERNEITKEEFEVKKYEIYRNNPFEKDAFLSQHIYEESDLKFRVNKIISLLQFLTI